MQYGFKTAIALSFMVSSLSTLLFFQNCAEVQYVEPNANNSNQSIGDEYAERFIQLKPETESVEPTTAFKVLLVVDDSASMKKINDKLQASLDSLLVPIQNYPVLLKIITTSKLATDQATVQKGWSHKTTSLNIKSIISDAWRTKFSLEPNDAFENGYDVFFTLNHIDLYSFQKNDPDYLVKVANIKNRILELSNSGTGTQKEQALCNTLLALYDEGPYRLFQPGDKAAIIIVTDEDDSSTWHASGSTSKRSSCYNRYTYGNVGNPDVVKKQSTSYNLQTWNIRFTYSYDFNNDGKIENKNSTSDNGGLGLVASEFYSDYASKNPTSVIECTEAQKTAAYNYAKHLSPEPLNSNIVIQKCEIKSSWTALYGFGPNGENRCYTPFTEKNINYQNMADYYKRALNRVLVKESCKAYVSQSFSNRYISDFYIHNATDPEVLNVGIDKKANLPLSLQKSLLNRALDLFGNNSFSINAIIHKDAECLTSSASVGNKYMQLGVGSAAETSVRTMSICANDYNQVLGSLGQYIASVLKQELSFPKIKDDEIIKSASLIRAGVYQKLIAEQDYKIIFNADGSGTIKMINNILNENDIVEIQIIRKLN